MVPVGTDLEEETIAILTAAGLWETNPKALALTGRACPRCEAPTLRGENHYGITTHLDTTALDPDGELTAVLTSRLTYRLWASAPRTLTATRRWAVDITAHPANPDQPPAQLRSGPHGSPALVVAIHRCHTPLSTRSLRLPPLATTADFPTEPTY